MCLIFKMKVAMPLCGGISTYIKGSSEIRNDIASEII